MAKFISANLGILKTPIADSLAETHVMRRTGELVTQKIGLGWLADPLLNRQLIFHGGGTGGYVSLVALDITKKTGVFVATNSTSKSDDIGVHILENTYPLRKIKQSISFSAEILEKYVGEYQLAPTFSIVVTREGTQLYLQATSQPKFELFGEKDDEFFLKVVEASIIFTKDEAGKVVGLILKQGGTDNPGRKIK